MLIILMFIALIEIIEALLVNRKIKHTNIIMPNLCNIEAVGIEIINNDCKVIIVQVYIPHNKISKNDMDKIFKLGNKVIIMGDLNSRRIEWNCFASNLNGNILIDYCLSKQITIAAPVNPTHYPKIGRPSIIDFFLIKNFINYSQPVTKSILSSDHNPVYLILNHKIENTVDAKNYNYNNANWHGFRKYLDTFINLKFQINDRIELENKTDLLNTIINKAIEFNVPLQQQNIGNDKYSHVISSLIRIKNKFRRNYQLNKCNSNKNKLKILQKMINMKIREWNSEKWNRIIVNCKTNDGSLWKLVRRFSKTKKAIPPLHSQGTLIYNDVDKANALVEQFCIHANQSDVPINKHHDKTVNNFVNKFIINANINRDNFKMVSPAEVYNTIRILKNNKSPGHDNVTNIILKNLSRKTIVMISKILNGMFTTGHFPSCWKIAKVVPILKPNKNNSLPVSYRPISLLPSLSKVAERIIKNRLD